MGFFTTRERTELDKGADMEGEIRDFVRQDVVTMRRKPETEGQSVANNLTALLQRVVGTSEQQIDSLIAELEMLREKLENDGARVRREIVEYASLSQSAMRSTKIISESLAHWKQIPDAPSLAPDAKASSADFSSDH
jgi:hypothetical protein